MRMATTSEESQRHRNGNLPSVTLQVWTVGHGTLPAAAFRELLGGAGVAQVMDVRAFRAYADHMETPDFAAGIDRLLSAAEQAPTAVMCAESLWWRCHRRLVSDALV